MLPSTAGRVEEHTSHVVNARIRTNLQRRVSLYRSAPPDQLDHRLRELDQEWDIERALQTNFALLSAFSVALASQVDRRWTALSLGVPFFMLQHALQGWCPPLPVLRRRGLRTSREIDEERFALKAIRGDFAEVEDSKDAEAIVRAVLK